MTVTTSPFSIHTVKLKIVEGTHQLTFGAHGVIDVLSLQPFHVLVSNVSAKEVNLPKQMMDAYVTGPPTSVMTASSTLQH